MKNGHNELIKQSDNQRSPGLSRPQDFKINPPDTNNNYPYHGQLGDSAKECAELLKVGPQSRGEQNAAKSESNIEDRIQRELARENGGSKQEGE